MPTPIQPPERGPGAVLVLRLAWRDLAAEAMLAVCSAVAISAILAPLVVLAGLRAGVMTGLRQSLLEDPHAREIATVANRTFQASQLAVIAARPDVAFLLPKTRTLAASVLLQSAESTADPRRVELVPTGPGDPLLSGRSVREDGDIILSASAAASLQVSAGARLQARIARLVDGRQELALVPLLVRSVAAPAVITRDAAFVTLAFCLSVEDYQEGGGSTFPLHPAKPGSFAGFRLYATRLDQVPALDTALRGMGIDIVSRAGDVAGLLALDQHLSMLFLLVASLGAAGFLVSVGAGLWASVERKRRSLALLRFIGLPGWGLLLFPLAQSAFLALAGGLLGLTAAYGVAMLIDRLFIGTLPAGQELCVITPLLAGLSLMATLSGASAASLFAGRRAASIEAWEGVAGL
jgi:putative ABC transport system permease protein